MELLNQTAEEYDWEIIKREVEPEFKEAALDFPDREHSFICPRKDELNQDLQETFPFLDDVAETDVTASDRNPNGAGRKGQDFISYLKAFLLAPVLRVEQNTEAIDAAITGNPAFYVACGFTHHPASRTLRYFDQIMCEYGLWDMVHELAYKKNVDDELIDESEEHVLNMTIRIFLAILRRANMSKSVENVSYVKIVKIRFQHTKQQIVISRANINATMPIKSVFYN